MSEYNLYISLTFQELLKQRFNYLKHGLMFTTWKRSSVNVTFLLRILLHSLTELNRNFHFHSINVSVFKANIIPPPGAKAPGDVSKLKR